MVIDSQTLKGSDLSFSCSVQESQLYVRLTVVHLEIGFAVAHWEVRPAEAHQPLYPLED